MARPAIRAIILLWKEEEARMPVGIVAPHVEHSIRSEADDEMAYLANVLEAMILLQLIQQVLRRLFPRQRFADIESLASQALGIKDHDGPIAQFVIAEQLPPIGLLVIS